MSKTVKNCNLVCSFANKLLSTGSRLMGAPNCQQTSRRLNSSAPGGISMKRLANKTVLVTGSSYGIGHSIARRCYLEGANVIISSRKEENVQKAVKELRDSIHNDGTNEVHGIACHVGKEDERQRLVDFTLEKFGRIDGFVSNAAVNPHIGTIDEIEESKVDKLYEVNYKSHLILTQKILPHMRKIGKEKPTGCGPSIIFISTAAGFIGIPYVGAYSVSKASLFTLTKVLAQENGKYNIRVNCIAPGLIDTAFAKSLVEKREMFGHYMNNLLGRMGHVHEMDGCASFLLSDDSSYLTNEIINITGGILARY